MQMLDHLFRLEEHGTNVWTEVRAGVVTFLTLSYILFVNPQILSQAGLPSEDVVVATALASALATAIAAENNNRRIALAVSVRASR